METMQKKGPLGLIKKFFGLTLAESKAEHMKMTELDEKQLGSAIARAEGIPPEELSFDLVPY